MLCKSCKRTIEKKIKVKFKANASASAVSDTKKEKSGGGRDEGAESVEDSASDKKEFNKIIALILEWWLNLKCVTNILITHKLAIKIVDSMMITTAVQTRK